MLRLLALGMLLANLLYFGWSLGWLDGLVGIRAQGDRDPQRLQRQVRPEVVRLSPVAETGLAATPAAASEPAATQTADPATPSTPAVAASAVAAAASKPADVASKPAASAPVVTAAASRPATVASAVAAAASRPATVASAVAAAASRPGAAASAVAAARATPAASASGVARSGPDASASAPAPASSDAVAQAGPASAAVEYVCLEAGPFAAADVAAAEAAVRNAAPLANTTQRRVPGGEWMIYMGPYEDEATLERKKAELSRIRGGPAFVAVRSTSLFGPGISLGRFASKAEADRQLEQYRPRGVRTARVIPSGDGPSRTILRVARADTAIAERLASVELPAGQSGFKPCAAAR